MGSMWRSWGVYCLWETGIENAKSSAKQQKSASLCAQPLSHRRSGGCRQSGGAGRSVSVPSTPAWSQQSLEVLTSALPAALRLGQAGASPRSLDLHRSVGVPQPNRSSDRGRTGASDVSVTDEMMSAPWARMRTSSHSRHDRKPLLKRSVGQTFALTNRYKGWLGKVEVRALAGDLPVERQIQGRRS